MKRFTLVLVVVLAMVCSAGGAFAQTAYVYPDDDPVFAIAFPDDWEVELDEDGAGVIALSPDGEIEIDIWPLGVVEDADDVEAALAEAAEEIDELLAENVTDFDPGDMEVIEVNGITFLSIDGPATYIESGNPATISVNFFSPDDETVFALLYWGNPAADDAYAEILGAIINSIQTP
jgi:hypothetical protein